MSNPASDLFDASVRVETIIWIPGVVGERFPEVFEEEFFDNMPERADAPLYQQLPLLAQYRPHEEAEEFEVDEVAEALLPCRGFLVQAATPVRQYRKNGVFTYSWGYYHTEWLYAPTEADIAKVCLAWTEETSQRDKAEAAALLEEEVG